MIRKVLVHYAGWGEQWLLGTLAHDGHDLLFEYSADALRQGLELSPRHLPLRPGVFSGFPAHQQHLPGLIADALPDGWGLLLMDRLFRKSGVNPAMVSPLDRLSFLGERTLDARLGAFGIARFDVEDGLRVPVHTLAGALQVDFRLPSAVDYTTLLRATRLFTRDEHEVRKAYERAVFNVVFHNRDDHAKNVSFRLGRDRHWRLAPCYDLTFSEGPGGEHQMDVCGEGRDITRMHLLKLASQGGLDRVWAASVVDRMVELAGRFSTLAAGRSIRPATVRRVRSAIEANRLRLA